MTALTPCVLKARLRDITTNDVVTSDSDFIIACDWSNEADAAEPSNPSWVEVTAKSPLAPYLIAARGGNQPSTSTLKYFCDLSVDNGESYDHTFIVEQIIATFTVVAQGRPLSAGYSDAMVARLTLSQVTLAQALNATAGTIQAVPQNVPGGIQYVFDNIQLPYQKGHFQGNPNPPDGYTDPTTGRSLYAMPVVISPSIASLLVDGDTNSNFIDRSATEYLNLTVGIPIGAVPLGSYSHIVYDTSDAALNLTGQDHGIGVGLLGISDFLTFERNPNPTDVAKALIIEPGEGLSVLTDLSQPMTRLTGIGGYSNHGLPDGFQILQGICLLDPTQLGSTVDPYASLYVFVGQTSDGIGGVYFWGHNGLAYRLGQELDGASCIAYDSVAKLLYVGTKNGVYVQSPDPRNRNLPWTKLGGKNGLGYTVIAVRAGSIPVGDTTVATVNAWVQGSGPADGLYRWPGVAGTPTGLGYDGWSVLDTNGAIIGYKYDPAADSLLVSYIDNASQVVYVTSASTDTPISSTFDIDTTSGDNCSGIDDLGGYGAAIRTLAGARGLYLFGAGGITNLNQDGSLIDRYEDPVATNSVQLSPAGSLYIEDASSGIREQAVRFICNTDAGPYITASDTGGGWCAMPLQSGIGDKNVLSTAIGKPQTLINRATTRVYCATDQGLWVSHTAGIYFDAEQEDPTNQGVFMSQLGVLSAGGQGTLLDNDVTAIGFHGVAGKSDAPSGTGTSGQAIYVNIVSPPNQAVLQDIPAGTFYLRPLNERNKWEYQFMDVNGANPTGRIAPAEFPTLQSDNATPAATASGKVAQALVRKYMDAAVIPHDVQIDSILPYQELNLRKLRPTHRVKINYNNTSTSGEEGMVYFNDLTASHFYIRSVRFYKQRTDNVLQVQILASTKMQAAVATDDQLGSALSDIISKMNRSGKRPA